MKRYDLIDTWRGLAVIGMIGFHLCWMMSYFGIAIPSEMLFGPFFMAWERSVCISFIVVAGYSFSLGHKHLLSGIKVFLIGLVITAVTCIFIPDIRIIFGVLTFIGTATLLMIPVDKAIGQKSLDSSEFRWIGLIFSMLLFLAAYNINNGYLGFKGFSVPLPKSLYSGYVATFIGFKDPDFYSADYFALLPWIFMYLFGYFLHKAVKGTSFESNVMVRGIPGIKAIGRHSLIIYIVHPIVIYGILYLIQKYG
ncbi:MAG: DUF1624 domain-containing protein [Lachnospiraceae bacterium]|nr:DUF1624 domain-containing protein [Lachnospiraceae bacterium]